MKGQGQGSPGRGAQPHFGDNEFKGTGKIRCRVCGEPTRDHERIGPCPALGERTIKAVAPRRGELDSATKIERQLAREARAVRRKR